MKEGKEENDDKKKVLISKMSPTVTRKHRFHKNTKVMKFNWRRNMGKSGHYWDGCYWMGRGGYQYVHVWCTHTLDKNRLCIRSRKTGDCTAVTTLKESKDLHCDPRVQEEKHVYLLFLLLAFSKNLTFLLVVAGTLGQEEARRGKRKMALITGKRGQWELVVTIAETIQLIFMLYVFLIFFFLKKEQFAPLILVHHF